MLVLVLLFITFISSPALQLRYITSVGVGSPALLQSLIIFTIFTNIYSFDDLVQEQPALAFLLQILDVFNVLSFSCSFFRLALHKAN